MKHSRLILAKAALVSLVAADVALAQGMVKGKSEAGGGGGRDFAVSLPLALYGESVARLELNLSNHASLAVELNVKRSSDDIDEEQAKETHESLVTDAKGGLLLVSRYSEPTRLAGFYWSLGLGWREMNADWQVQPDPADKHADYSLASPVEDSDASVFHHRATLIGTTGHLRAGYRYVAEELPLMIGAYLGVRHFQASVKDVELKDEEMADKTYVYAAMTERERERLKRRYMTQLEPAVEIGFIF